MDKTQAPDTLGWHHDRFQKAVAQYQDDITKIYDDELEQLQKKLAALVGAAEAALRLIDDNHEYFRSVAQGEVDQLRAALAQAQPPLFTSGERDRPEVEEM